MVMVTNAPSSGAHLFIFALRFVEMCLYDVLILKMQLDTKEKWVSVNWLNFDSFASVIQSLNLLFIIQSFVLNHYRKWKSLYFTVS